MINKYSYTSFYNFYFISIICIYNTYTFYCYILYILFHTFLFFCFLSFISSLFIPIFSLWIFTKLSKRTRDYYWQLQPKICWFFWSILDIILVKWNVFVVKNIGYRLISISVKEKVALISIRIISISIRIFNWTQTKVERIFTILLLIHKINKIF